MGIWVNQVLFGKAGAGGSANMCRRIRCYGNSNKKQRKPRKDYGQTRIALVIASDCTLSLDLER
jgi:hypothetical protein